ncbi:MAG: hypothetical protein ACK56I_27410 [bacterium]
MKVRKTEVGQLQIPFVGGSLLAHGDDAFSREAAAGAVAPDIREFQPAFFEGERAADFAGHDDAGKNGFRHGGFALRVAVGLQCGACRDALRVKERPRIAVLEKNARAADFHTFDAHGEGGFLPLHDLGRGGGFRFRRRLRGCSGRT